MRRLLSSLLLVAVAAHTSWREISCEEIVLVVSSFDVTGVAGEDASTGALLADLLSAELSNRDALQVVERGQFENLLAEQSLNRSGVLATETAAKVGCLLGAQVLITGRAFSLNRRLIVTARMIRTDTGVVSAVVDEGDVARDPSDVARVLARKISQHLSRDQTRLPPRGSGPSAEKAPPEEPHVDRGDGETPSRVTVLVSITEKIAGAASDRSLAEDQLSYSLLDRGFDVYVADDGKLSRWLTARRANPEAPLPDQFHAVDIVLFGEATVTPGPRTGDLITAKARLTVSAYDCRRRDVLLTHRSQTESLDVAFPGAAEAAIRQAADRSVAAVISRLSAAASRRSR